jgi:protein-S-isoprenylcysteine O-methyltransferase Ste14
MAGTDQDEGRSAHRAIRCTWRWRSRWFALGFATRVGWYFVLLAPVLALMHWGEERYLSHKFGAPYDEYRQRVRRYL